MKGRGKRTLHATPPEFAEAAAEQARLRDEPGYWARWERAQRDAEERERIRNMKMPAHHAPLTFEERMNKLLG